MERAFIATLLSASLLLGTIANAQTTIPVDDWQLRRDRDGIQVYSGDVAGSPYDAVRTITVIDDTSLSALVALITDAESCPNWADRCEESYIVDQQNPKQALVYTHNDLPFPIMDRDVVSQIQWQQDPVSRMVSMESHAVAGVVEEKRGRLRLTHADVSWYFTPLSDSRVEVKNIAHIDPGSALPGWVTNMLLVDTPFETVRALRDEIRKDNYRDASVPFLVEPARPR
ncbi:MAG: START domain-containing protein [Gammaproteobacteria bacterium]